jgi:AcrR family transcriptional regulator
MSKKTIYSHFPNKTALLEAMLLEKFRCVEEDLQAITSECSADFATGLHRLVTCLLRHTEEIQPPFMRDIQREAPELFQVVQDRRREVIQKEPGDIHLFYRAILPAGGDIPSYSNHLLNASASGPSVPRAEKTAMREFGKG